MPFPQLGPPVSYADFTGLLLSDTVHELRSPTPGSEVPSAIWLGFCAAALTISVLNYYWFSLMLRTLAKVLSGKHTWTAASDGKNE